MKKFKELLIAGINEDITGSTVERLIKVKEIFQAEMIYKGIKPSAELLTQWLQGLCWAIHVPYENDAILEWYESTIKRKLKRDHERSRHNMTTEAQRFLDSYWQQCGKDLSELLYQ